MSYHDGYNEPFQETRQLDLECETCGTLHEDVRDMDEGMDLDLLTLEESTGLACDLDGETVHGECGGLVFLAYQHQQTERDPDEAYEIYRDREGE